MRRTIGLGLIVSLLAGVLNSIVHAAGVPAFRRVDLPNRLKYARLGAIADATGDGRLDFVVGSGSGLMVLPGDGTAEFPNWYAAADDRFFADNLATADFNNDGHVDVVVGGVLDVDHPTEGHILRVYLNDGSGHFRRAFEVDPGNTGGIPRPHVGDFNGDGLADFVFIRIEFGVGPDGYGRFSGVLETYLSDGTGGFRTPVRTALPDQNSSYPLIYVGDLNGDGRTDVITSDRYASTINVSLATPSGAFEAPTALTRPPTPRDRLTNSDPPGPADVVAGDLNGDGRRDLLIRYHYTARSPGYIWGEPREFTSMYFGDGSGHFGAPLPLPEPAEHRRTVVSQIIADVNHDGRDDVLLTSPNSFEDNSPLYGIYFATDLYLSIGAGLFASPLLSPNSGGQFIGGLEIQAGLHDLDGDGNLDLVTETGDAFNIARGNGAGSFAPAQAAGAYDFYWVPGTATGDFNGDGHPDLAVANSGTYNVSVWLGDGTGGWSGPMQYEAGERQGPITIISADLNNDGALDLATASFGDGPLPAGVSILTGDGAGHFALSRELHTGRPSGLVAADFDRDGKIDLAVGDNSTRTVDIFFDIAGDSRQVTLRDPQDEFDGSDYAIAGLVSADFDGNGLPDLARSSLSGVADVFLNPGDPAQQRTVRLPAGTVIYNLAAGDIDGDGAADLAFTVYDSSKRTAAVQIRRGNGSGGFAAPATYPLNENALINNVAIVDLDGNGQRAVVLQSNYLQVLVADQSGHLGTPYVFDYGTPLTRNLALVDVNHDGLLDALRPDAVFLNLATCGNGRLDGTEECDDGNTVNCDGCSTTCHIEPGARCGDGIVNGTCGEQCDAGVENSDTQADACRTTCKTPRCGDGVLDSGEACDDGNTRSCDGCSATCTVQPAPVCGDGITDLTCGEQCDDGNRSSGDGCSPTCTPELIPGGGAAKTDCFAEWVVTNPSNTPRLDNRGRFSRKQTCHDNDPSCDFDGGVVGSCTFHVAMCARVDDRDLLRCIPAPLASYQVMKPSATQALTSSVAATLRAQIDALGESMMTQPAGTCSLPADLTIPIGTRLLRLRATSSEGKRDTDTLKFTCAP